MLRRIFEWVDRRMGLWNHPPGIIKGLLERRIPRGVNWAYTLGSATTVTFMILVITGIMLTMYYQAAPTVAFHSLQYLDERVFLGHFIRNLHHWAASLMVILVAAHMTRTFYYGAYKYPRELTWLTGCFLLVVTLAFAFSGYLLPWDQKAYWTTILLTRMAETAPFIGESAKILIQGGMEVSSRTLTRFYGFHMWVLPAITVVFIVAHIGLVIRQGISNPPSFRQEPYADDEDPRQAYDEFYADQKKAGEPFYLNVLEDCIVALGVVLLLFAAAAFLPHELGEPASPLGAGFAPRPEWYFSWLFQLLRYFPGKLEPLGVIGMPILLGTILLIVPFLDRGPFRHPLRRPVTVSLWTASGLAVLWLTLVGISQTAPSAKGTEPPPKVAKSLSDQGKAGWRVFNTYGCLNCHQIGSAGTPVGPALTDVGSRRDRAFLEKWVRDPKAINPKSTMPAYPQIPAKDYDDLIAFLSELK